MTETADTSEDRLGKLHSLLIKCCPPDKNTHQSILLLARAIPVSTQAIYLWIQDDRVPQDRVKRLVKLSNGRATVEEFVPFLVK